MMHGLDAIRLENSGVPGEGYGPGFERGINERLFCASKKSDDEIYLEGWLSPRRFRRSRRRRCNGVGVLGLKATRYHNGWLRSLLSQVSVVASAFGCRATFSRIAPYGCFASLFSVLALARGCSLISRSR